MLTLIKELTGVNQKKRDRLTIIKHELKKIRVQTKEIEDKLDKPLSLSICLAATSKLHDLHSREMRLENEQAIIEAELS